jgi:hypothetical protein
MPLKQTIFAYEVDKSPRSLFTVREDLREDIPEKFGELTITLTHAELFGFAEDVYRPKTIQQKYSIHPSIKSDRYTTFKHTIVLNDRIEQTTAFLSDAIKKKNGFAIVYVRLNPDLRNDRYAIPSDAENVISLGEIDPISHTLIHGILVCHKDLDFGASENPHLQVYDVIFNQCKLIVLHYLAPLPSSSEGQIEHLMTTPPEKIAGQREKRLMQHAMKGRTKAVASGVFAGLLGLMVLKEIRRILPSISDPALRARLESDEVLLSSGTREFQKKIRTGQPATRTLTARKPATRR